jgi:hypothetical protein
LLLPQQVLIFGLYSGVFHEKQRHPRIKNSYNMTENINMGVRQVAEQLRGEFEHLPPQQQIRFLAGQFYARNGLPDGSIRQAPAPKWAGTFHRELNMLSVLYDYQTQAQALKLTPGTIKSRVK